MWQSVNRRAIFIRWLLLACLPCLLTHLAQAQSGNNQQITQAVIAGGGASSSSASLQVDGTIGQSVTGTSSGGPYSLGSGFWAAGSSALLPASLSVSGAAGTYGSTATLTATLSANGTNLSGKLITFSLNANPVGTATTDSGGIATLAGVSLSGINAGSYPGAVSAQFAGDTTFAATGGTAQLTVQKASQTITFGALMNKTYGDADFNVSATASSGLGVSFTAIGQCTVTGNTVHLTGAGSCTIGALQSGNNNYTAATDILQSFTINKAAPAISWNNPSNIIYGTPLSATQLNATASVAGTFTYTPPAGTVLNTGAHQLSVTFTPTETANYTTATANVSITIDPVTAAALNFDNAIYTVNEGDGHVTIVVNRTGGAEGAATVNYSTSDTAALTNCDVTGGIASSRCDYATTTGTLRFAPGEMSKTIFIPLVDDSFAEGPESFQITLSSARGENLGAVSTATIMITDNETTTGTNPVSNVPFFVRQQYIDFLGREPDPIGFTGWQNILNNCVVGDTSCDRISVSSGFFRSPEFQTRGYFIFRFYAAALGRNPGYAEFMPDMGRVSGFLTDAQLEANKGAFVQDVMTRSEYVNRYGSLGNSAFVDTLIQTAGLQGHPLRGPWIDSLNNQTATRAQVLRAFVESQEVYDLFYNQAFVVMQYFGYLRRDPDAMYTQWIQTLNQTNDYRMLINGFLNSNEYVLRFGP